MGLRARGGGIGRRRVGDRSDPLPRSRSRRRCFCGRRKGRSSGDRSTSSHRSTSPSDSLVTPRDPSGRARRAIVHSAVTKGSEIRVTQTARTRSARSRARVSVGSAGGLQRVRQGLSEGERPGVDPERDGRPDRRRDVGTRDGQRRHRAWRKRHRRRRWIRQHRQRRNLPEPERVELHRRGDLRRNHGRQYQLARQRRRLDRQRERDRRRRRRLERGREQRRSGRERRLRRRGERQPRGRQHVVRRRCSEPVRRQGRRLPVGRRWERRSGRQRRLRSRWRHLVRLGQRWRRRRRRSRWCSRGRRQRSRLGCCWNRRSRWQRHRRQRHRWSRRRLHRRRRQR